MTNHRYFIINKPINMVSQFVSSHEVRLLGELDFEFPEGTHAVGRLDAASEGLLILTTNKKVTRLLFMGEKPHKRTYWVNVDHAVSDETVELLRAGIPIRVKGGSDYLTAPCEVDIIERPPVLEKHKNEDYNRIPNTWLRISLTEGKYHQVRKMVWAARHRCKRLVRASIEDLELGDLPPGGVKEIEENVFFSLLSIENFEHSLP